MDYIEEIFNKYSKILIYRGTKKIKVTRTMTLQDFREAVKDIEADHLKRVCKIE